MSPTELGKSFFSQPSLVCVYYCFFGMSVNLVKNFIYVISKLNKGNCPAEVTKR